MASRIPDAVIAILHRTQAFAQARGVQVYLVGGWLRDQWLGRVRVPPNVDLAVARGAVALARDLAVHLGGAFVPLDDAAGSARVVVRAGEGRLELDLSDFRAPTLAEDLARRDVTINAMAISLADWLRHPDSPQPVVDPLGGQQALREGRLEICYAETFQEDPVRILRVARFIAQLGFAGDEPMRARLREAAPLLTRVSGERVREELLAIFATDRAGDAVAMLDELGALEVLIPELGAGRGMRQGDVHHLDVLSHQVETVRQADRLLADCGEFAEPLRAPLVAYCAQELVEGRSRKTLLKLSGLIHDVGKPSSRQIHPDGDIWFIGHEHAGADLAAAIVARLRLANREAAMVCDLVRHHLRPGFLSREPQLTPRAIYRFYKDLGDHGPACVLGWWCDRMATRGPSSRLDQMAQQRSRAEELLHAYFFKAAEVVRPPRLVDGRRLMAALQLPPGPLIGALLDRLEEAQAEGRLRTADEALALARAYLQQHPTP